MSDMTDAQGQVWARAGQWLAMDVRTRDYLAVRGSRMESLGYPEMLPADADIAVPPDEPPPGATDRMQRGGKWS